MQMLAKVLAKVPRVSRVQVPRVPRVQPPASVLATESEPPESVTAPEPGLVHSESDVQLVARPLAAAAQTASVLVLARRPAAAALVALPASDLRFYTQKQLALRTPFAALPLPHRLFRDAAPCSAQSLMCSPEIPPPACLQRRQNTSTPSRTSQATPRYRASKQIALHATRAAP